MNIQTQVLTPAAVTPTETKELTQAEVKALRRCEEKIDAGFKTFAEAGRALIEIRDSRLYRGTHATFDAYCEDRWHFKRSYGLRLIAAAQVCGRLSPMGDAPTSERQARPLAKLPAAEQPAAWSEANAVAKTEGREVTAQDVEAAVTKRKPKSSRKDKNTRASQPVPAHTYAEAAIHQLEQIAGDDPGRAAALQAVIEFCNEQLGSHAPLLLGPATTAVQEGVACE